MNVVKLYKRQIELNPQKTAAKSKNQNVFLVFLTLKTNQIFFID